MNPQRIQTAVFLLILLLLTACSLPTDIVEVLTTPNPTVPDVEVVATPVPQGYTRSSPLPGHIPQTFANWEVEILDTVRGEKAYHALLQANSLNDLPPDGWEYFLVRYRVRSLLTGDEEKTVGLHVTGDSNRVHFSFDNSAVPPDPSLETYLPGGAESEGWEVYLIQQGEDDLLVVVDDLSDYEQPEQYIAIEEGNRVTVNEELLDSITPTNVGTHPNEPTLVGQVVTTEDWQLSVLEVYSGDKAWQRILDANQFNDPPEKGMVYILVKMRLRYIGLKEEGERVSLYSDFMTLIDSESNVYDLPSVVDPEPELDAHLFPGGSVEGWITFQAPEEIIPELRILFQPRTNTVDNMRYLSLVDYGR
ncbi:MAG: hypothetical protein KC419_11825 [Anaerolineales bacterium]|nr:hypothetical protein [Anaerolineales bacterium]